MAIMGFLAVANAYAMRVCLNIAITQMVHKRTHSATGNDGSCPAEDAVGVAVNPTVSYHNNSDVTGVVSFRILFSIVCILVCVYFVYDLFLFKNIIIPYSSQFSIRLLPFIRFIKLLYYNYFVRKKYE